MQGYKSALKKYFETKDFSFEACDLIPGNITLDKWLNNFIKGYAK